MLGLINLETRLQEVDSVQSLIKKGKNKDRNHEIGSLQQHDHCTIHILNWSESRKKLKAGWVTWSSVQSEYRFIPVLFIFLRSTVSNHSSCVHILSLKRTVDGVTRSEQEVMGRFCSFEKKEERTRWEEMFEGSIRLTDLSFYFGHFRGSGSDLTCSLTWFCDWF